MTAAAHLQGGFTDAPVQSSRAFRAVLDVLARPGTIATLDGAAPPAPLSTAAGTLLLTLADATTPVHLAPSHDAPDVRAWLTFHTGAPFADAGAATFAVGTWDSLQPVQRFPVGTPEYPDRSATLIVEVPALAPEGPRLTGPGIRDTAHLSLPETTVLRANHALFPLGFDTFLTAGNRIAGLPRSTAVGDA